MAKEEKKNTFTSTAITVIVVWLWREKTMTTGDDGDQMDEMKFVNQFATDNNRIQSLYSF